MPVADARRLARQTWLNPRGPAFQKEAVKRVEADSKLRVSESAREKLQKALEAAGIKFIDENGAGPGVRFRNKLSGCGK